MVRIRLRRVGAKKQPSYRVVVTDQRSPRDGRFIETVGHYNPRTEPATLVLKDERVLFWLSQGARPSEAVDRMLKSTGIWDRHTSPQPSAAEAVDGAEPTPGPATAGDAAAQA